MNEGKIVLIALPQADGQIKNRPALLLRVLPPFNDALLCGISTQLSREVKGFDELITPSDEDFTASGLVSASIIRLGFLSVVARHQLLGSIGQVAPLRHSRLLQNLSNHLLQGISSGP
jgi:mRNA interferase MazF